MPEEIIQRVEEVANENFLNYIKKINIPVYPVRLSDGTVVNAFARDNSELLADQIKTIMLRHGCARRTCLPNFSVLRVTHGRALLTGISIHLSKVINTETAMSSHWRQPLHMAPQHDINAIIFITVHGMTGG